MRLCDWVLNFTANHPTWTGIIAGILIGFIPSIYAGHLANQVTERRSRNALKAKQKKFIDGLNATAKPFVTSAPKTDEEVSKRRNTVAESVETLSQELFQQDYPELESIRPESTEYPDLPCKWCHQPHKAFAGSRGDCTHCNLPLDFWIGCQGETHKT